MNTKNIFPCLMSAAHSFQVPYASMSLGLFSSHTMTGFLNDTAASVSHYIQSTKAMFEWHIRNIIPKVVESSLRTLIHGPLMPERPIGTVPLARSIVALWSIFQSFFPQRIRATKLHWESTPNKHTHKTWRCLLFGWWPAVNCWLLLVFVVTVAVFLVAVGCCCCCRCQVPLFLLSLMLSLSSLSLFCHCCRCPFHCCRCLFVAVAVAVAIFSSLSLSLSFHCCRCFCRRCRCLSVAVVGFFVIAFVIIINVRSFCGKILQKCRMYIAHQLSTAPPGNEPCWRHYYWICVTLL